MNKKTTIVILFSVLTAALWSVNARELKLHEVPDSLSDPLKRAEFVLAHYWDAMDWHDTTATRDTQFMEQSAVDFYSLFYLTDSIGASRAARKMLDGAAADAAAYREVAAIAQAYLYDVESPVVDDEAFIVMADLLLEDAKLPRADLLRWEDARQSAMLNRVGNQAADFRFVTRDGATMTLHEALKAHHRSVVMFYDPDCHVCAHVEEQLEAADLGDTGVVMISPYGGQDGLWARHAAGMPATWTVGRPLNDDFEDEEIYDLRATPMLLLIDSDGKVLGKHTKALEMLGINLR